MVRSKVIKQLLELYFLTKLQVVLMVEFQCGKQIQTPALCIGLRVKWRFVVWTLFLTSYLLAAVKTVCDCGISSGCLLEQSILKIRWIAN